MPKIDDEIGGLRPGAARWLGFEDPCTCGHVEGMHDEHARCTVLDCQCVKFTPREWSR